LDKDGQAKYTGDLCEASQHWKLYNQAAMEQSNKQAKIHLGEHYLQTWANLNEQLHKGQEATGAIKGT